MNQYDKLWEQIQSNALSKDASLYRDLARITKRNMRSNLIGLITNLTLVVIATWVIILLPKDSPFIYTCFSMSGSFSVLSMMCLHEYFDAKFSHNLYLKILLLLYGDKSEIKKTDNVSYLKPL